MKRGYVMDTEEINKKVKNALPSINKSLHNILGCDLWETKDVDEHRKGISDHYWRELQRKGEPKYRVGDGVEFMVGGYGRITEVRGMNPPHYATEPISGKPYHPKTTEAWHFEGDFLRKIGETPPFREFENIE